MTVDQLRSMTQAAGRVPASLRIVSRYNLAMTSQAQGKDGGFFSETLAQIKDDMVAVKDFEQDELILDPTFSSDSQTDEGFLRNMEEILRMV